MGLFSRLSGTSSSAEKKRRAAEPLQRFTDFSCDQKKPVGRYNIGGAAVNVGAILQNVTAKSFINAASTHRTGAVQAQCHRRHFSRSVM